MIEFFQMPKGREMMERIKLTYNLNEISREESRSGLGATCLICKILMRRRKKSGITLDFIEDNIADITLTKNSFFSVMDYIFKSEEAEREKKNGETFKYFKSMVPFIQEYYGKEQVVNLYSDFFSAYLRCKSGNGIFDPQKSTLKNLKENLWKILNQEYGIEDKPKTKGKLCLDRFTLSSNELLDVEEKNSSLIDFYLDSKTYFITLPWFLCADIRIVKTINMIKSVKDFKKTETGKPKFIEDYWGKVVSIPNIINLKEFCEVFPKYADILANSDLSKKRIPSYAFVLLREQSALESERIFHDFLVNHGKNLEDIISHYKYIHVSSLPKKTGSGKDRRNLKIGYVCTGDKIKEYKNIIESKNRSQIYTYCMVKNIIDEGKWFDNFSYFLENLPIDFFINKKRDKEEETDFLTYNFSLRIRQNFENIAEELDRSSKEMKENDPTLHEKEIEDFIFKSVKKFVNTKIHKRLTDGGFYSDPDKRKIHPDKLPKSREIKNKIRRELYYDFMGRNSQNFLRFFLDNIVSIPENYHDIEASLRLKREAEANPSIIDNVKTLALLSIAGSSVDIKKGTNSSEESSEESESEENLQGEKTEEPVLPESI